MSTSALILILESAWEGEGVGREAAADAADGIVHAAESGGPETDETGIILK